MFRSFCLCYRRIMNKMDTKRILIRLGLYLSCIIVGMMVSQSVLVASNTSLILGSSEVLMGIDASTASAEEKEKQKSEVLRRSSLQITKLALPYTLGGVVLGFAAALLLDKMIKPKRRYDKCTATLGTLEHDHS